jgi:predicted dehydrogenase
MPDPFGEIRAQPAPAVETRYPVPDGFERNQLFMAQMRHFLEVARGEAEPVCTLDDGVRALELALAAKEFRK